MKKILAVICLSLLLLSCEGPQARRPVEVKSGSFLKLSADRNKKLLEMEESLMNDLVQRDSLHEYLRSASGFLYYFDHQIPGEGYRPKTDDLVTLTYDLRTWNDDTLYRQAEIGTIRY
ncbi:MAG: gliding motility-associated peptidyl-prolyl isomerase GldI, partial [Bacteroidetes bacterium]